MLRTADLEYNLPPDRIATHPAHPRDSAKLLVVDRSTGRAVGDRTVRDLPSLLRPGDLLVFNATRVLPARFRGVRKGTGGKIEGLWIGESGPGRWVCLIKGRHTRAGAQLTIFDSRGRPAGIELLVTGRPASEPEAWEVQVQGADGLSTPQVLEHIGLTPLPPYILKARRDAGDAGDDAADREEYQTVYAKSAGSVAAPTAGLHFTPELLAALDRAGVRRAEVTLHVGTGTFRPVETEFVEQHPMHSEWCTMPEATLEAIHRVRAEGGRVIPVGTTAARTIESYAGALDVLGTPTPREIETRLLITPGYSFRWCHGLMTNFHLPRSTLLAMVAALLEPGGLDRLKALYGGAVERGYRFYSFGDAMLIV